MQKANTKLTIKELPQSAVEYIYKDAEDKKALLSFREEMMREAMEIGYMPHAIKRVRKDILKFKIKNKVVKILKSTGIWKIIKK